MILSTHFITGATVASFTDNPPTLIVSALILHFVMDVIPHWQYVYTIPGLKKKRNQAFTALDLLAGPLIIAILVGTADLSRLLWLYLGGILAMLPDFFSFLSIIFPNNILLEKMLYFHDVLQKKSHRYGRVKIIGITTQLTVIFLAFWVLVS